MNVTKDGFKDRQLHIEDYLQMVSAEQKEYAEVSAHQRIAENNDIITDFQTDKLMEFDVSSMELVGYFTIALKPLTVRGETVSNTVKKKLMRVSELDEQSKTYTMSAYLIAQLGKNFKNGAEKKITGEELLELVWDIVEKMQYMGGGMVTFLEAENSERLLSFYQANRFQTFDTRQTATDSEEPHELVQLLRLL